MPDMGTSFAPDLAVLHPDTTTQAFWDAARERQLVYPQCAACATPRMPPAAVCPNCGTRPLVWKHAGGFATVYPYTISRQSFHKAVDDELPYVIALVELDDAPIRLITNIVSVDPDEVYIGMPVEVVWDEPKPGVVIPRFQPRATAQA